MNFEKALQAMHEGQMVRRKDWLTTCLLINDNYIMQHYIDNGVEVECHNLPTEHLLATDWEIYVKPIELKNFHWAIDQLMDGKKVKRYHSGYYPVAILGTKMISLDLDGKPVSDFIPCVDDIDAIDWIEV